jgi:hypothetical protein
MIENGGGDQQELRGLYTERPDLRRDPEGPVDRNAQANVGSDVGEVLRRNARNAVAPNAEAARESISDGVG